MILFQAPDFGVYGRIAVSQAASFVCCLNLIAKVLPTLKEVESGGLNYGFMGLWFFGMCVFGAHGFLGLFDDNGEKGKVLDSPGKGSPVQKGKDKAKKKKE